MTTTTTASFSVNYHGSDPRLELDQCWAGSDFATLEEACDEFARPNAEHASECGFDLGELWVELAQSTRTNEGLDSLVILEVRRIRAEAAPYRSRQPQRPQGASHSRRPWEADAPRRP